MRLGYSVLLGLAIVFVPLWSAWKAAKAAWLLEVKEGCELMREIWFLQ